MTAGTWNPAQRRGILAAALLTVAVAACAQGATPSQAQPSAAATTSVAPSATAAGPTAYADWIARQGFGGSSGLTNIVKLADWLVANDATATASDLTADRMDIHNLGAWLDAHPATACWTAYHASVRADLQALEDLYGTALEEVTKGSVHGDTAQAIAAAAKSAVDRSAPASCP